MKKRLINNLSPVKNYKNLYIACQQYPEIELQVNRKPLIIKTNNNRKLIKKR